MAKIAKKQRLALRLKLREWRDRVADASPPLLRRRLAPFVHYADMLFVDHGIFRIVYANRHALGNKAWRAAQPTPGQIRRYAREGIKTIVNLRGARYCGSYWLEQQACARHGIALIDFQVRSRAAPTRAELRAARDLLERIEYPMLMHCKSGADRAGLMSVLYRHLRDGVPIAAAIGELHLRYGHVRSASTGILDRFFEDYIAYDARHPIAFFQWVETVYEPETLYRSFHANRWSNLLVDRLLRRE